MNKIIGPAPLYTFLRFCNSSELDKIILDCGAGGKNPPLAMFYEHGYKTAGIDISDEQLYDAHKFCENNNMELNIVKGDMRQIPFEDETVSFIYSINSVFHLNKKDTKKAVNEIQRVLKKDGLCYLNFLSVDDCGYGEGTPVENGEFMQLEDNGTVIHSYYGDDEPDIYFQNMEVIRKEKRVIRQIIDEERYTFAYLDYIARKI